MTELVEGRFEPGDDRPLLRAIRAIPFLSMEHGAWVAGGAVRHLLGCPAPASDIDVFFAGRKEVLDKTSHPISTAFARLREMHKDGHWMTGRSLNGSISVHPAGQTPVQLIRRRGYANAEELIEDIDYTICRGVTDGHRWIADARMIPDIRAKRLVAVITSNVENQCGRLVKYVLHGYTPEPGTLSNALALHDPSLLRGHLTNSLRWPSSSSS